MWPVCLSMMKRADSRTGMIAEILTHSLFVYPTETFLPLRAHGRTKCSLSLSHGAHQSPDGKEANGTGLATTTETKCPEPEGCD